MTSLEGKTELKLGWARSIICRIRGTACLPGLVGCIIDNAQNGAFRQVVFTIVKPFYLKQDSSVMHWVGDYRVMLFTS
jgi:hypothetical protein